MKKFELLGFYDIGMQYYEMENDCYSVMIVLTGNNINATATAKPNSGCLDFHLYKDIAYSNDDELAIVAYQDIPKRIMQLKLLEEAIRLLYDALEKNGI